MQNPNRLRHPKILDPLVEFGQVRVNALPVRMVDTGHIHDVKQDRNITQLAAHTMRMHIHDGACKKKQKVRLMSND